MRRLGAILMIVGVNIIVGTLAAAYWRASFDCALKSTDGTCAEGVMALFFGQLFSGGGVGYWIVMAIGAFVIWRGKQTRARGDAPPPGRDQ